MNTMEQIRAVVGRHRTGALGTVAEWSDQARIAWSPVGAERRGAGWRDPASVRDSAWVMAS